MIHQRDLSKIKKSFGSSLILLAIYGDFTSANLISSWTADISFGDVLIMNLS